MARRIPVAVSVPIVIAAFSAGVVASLWEQDDAVAPSQVLSDRAPAAMPTDAGGAHRETAAVLRPASLDEPRSEHGRSPVTPSLPVALREGRGDAGLDPSERPGPVSFTKPDVSPSEITPPRETRLEAREEPAEPPVAVPTPVAPESIASRHEGEVVSSAPAAEIEVEIAAPAFTHPVAPPAELKAAPGKAPTVPKSANKAPPKRQPKPAEVSVFGKLFGWKY